MKLVLVLALAALSSGCDDWVPKDKYASLERELAATKDHPSYKEG